MSDAVVCPQCGSQEVQAVLWTWWGGPIGPSIFSLVSCNGCGTRFGARSGASEGSIVMKFYVLPFIITIIVLALLNN